MCAAVEKHTSTLEKKRERAREVTWEIYKMHFRGPSSEVYLRRFRHVLFAVARTLDVTTPVGMRKHGAVRSVVGTNLCHKCHKLASNLTSTWKLYATTHHMTPPGTLYDKQLHPNFLVQMSGKLAPHRGQPMESMHRQTICIRLSVMAVFRLLCASYWYHYFPCHHPCAHITGDAISLYLAASTGWSVEA